MDGILASRPFSKTVKKVQLTLLKHARTLGTPSLGPSMPGMKSILGPIQLKGLTMVNSRSFSAPSAAMDKKRNQYIMFEASQ